MSAEKNKEIVRCEFEEFWNNRKLSVADEVLSTELIHHDPNSPDVCDLASYKQWFANTLALFPDFQSQIDDIIAEGDKVAVRLTFHGTNTGSLPGWPATGKKVVIEGMTIYRLSGDKIVEIWQSWDQLGLLKQLGIKP